MLLHMRECVWVSVYEWVCMSECVWVSIFKKWKLEFAFMLLYISGIVGIARMHLRIALIAGIALTLSYIVLLFDIALKHSCVT